MFLQTIEGTKSGWVR